MTASGVFNSWEASAINCFCLLKASLTGAMERFAKYPARKEDDDEHNQPHDGERIHEIRKDVLLSSDVKIDDGISCFILLHDISPCLPSRLNWPLSELLDAAFFIASW